MSTSHTKLQPLAEDIRSERLDEQTAFEECLSKLAGERSMGIPIDSTHNPGEGARIVPKDDILVRLSEYGNRRSTSWEAAALCVAAHAEIQQLRQLLAYFRGIANAHRARGEALTDEEVTHG